MVPEILVNAFPEVKVFVAAGQLSVVGKPASNPDITSIKGFPGGKRFNLVISGICYEFLKVTDAQAFAHETSGCPENFVLVSNRA